MGIENEIRTEKQFKWKEKLNKIVHFTLLQSSKVFELNIEI